MNEENTRNSWENLTRLTRGDDFFVEKVRLTGSGVGIEGAFELPPLAVLSHEDQIFVAAFVRSHGSIKEMERLFGISYPTVKGRLRRIGDALGFAEVQPTAAPRSRDDALQRLARGEISVEEAVEILRTRRSGSPAIGD